jgi:hypothetical protein
MNGTAERTHNDRSVLDLVRAGEPETCFECGRLLQDPHEIWTYGAGALTYCRSCKTTFPERVWRRWRPLTSEGYDAPQDDATGDRSVGGLMQVGRAASEFLKKVDPDYAPLRERPFVIHKAKPPVEPPKEKERETMTGWSDEARAKARATRLAKKNAKAAIPPAQDAAPAKAQAQSEGLTLTEILEAASVLKRMTPADRQILLDFMEG